MTSVMLKKMAEELLGPKNAFFAGSQKLQIGVPKINNFGTQNMKNWDPRIGTQNDKDGTRKFFIQKKNV
jgi:hypothetical protein